MARKNDSPGKGLPANVLKDLIGRHLWWDSEDGIPEPSAEELANKANFVGDDPQTVRAALDDARRTYFAIARTARSNEMVATRRARLETMIFKGRPEVPVRTFLQKILPSVKKKHREHLAHEAFQNLGLIVEWVKNGCKVPKAAIDLYVKYDPSRQPGGFPLLSPSASGKVSLEEACFLSGLILIHHTIVSSHEFRGSKGRRKSTSKVGRAVPVEPSEEGREDHG